MNLLTKLTKRRTPKPFTGTIDRLLMFAGPTCAGKTTFLKEPERYINAANLPTEINDLPELARTHTDFRDFQPATNAALGNIMIHLCTVRALDFYENPVTSRDDIVRAFEDKPYTKQHGLDLYLNNASTLDIVIVFITRAQNLQHWLKRCLQYSKPNSSIRIPRIAFMSDPHERSLLHRKMYQAWLAHAQSFNPRSINVIHAKGDHKYDLMPLNDFREEIKTGNLQD